MKVTTTDPKRAEDRIFMLVLSLGCVIGPALVVAALGLDALFHHDGQSGMLLTPIFILGVGLLPIGFVVAGCTSVMAFRANAKATCALATAAFLANGMIGLWLWLTLTRPGIGGK